MRACGGGGGAGGSVGRTLCFSITEVSPHLLGHQELVLCELGNPSDSFNSLVDFTR